MKQQHPSRRQFIKQTGLTTTGLIALNLPSWAKLLSAPAGAFPVHNIPAKKGLDAQWVRSLYERGRPTTYLKSRNELKYIGMPAGGLHTGTVYLGGDGRLWLWGVYNDDREGIDPKTVLWNDGTKEVKVRNRDGASYVEPAIADNKRVLAQGFAIMVQTGKGIHIKELKEEDWEEIRFEATYPVATIHYSDPGFPVEVIVKAGGIFIPLDAANSSLPSTIYSIQLKNKTGTQVKTAVLGWLENGAQKITAKEGDGTKQNTAIRNEKFTSTYSVFKPDKAEAGRQRDAGSTCLTYIGKDATVNTNARLWPLTQEGFTEANEALAACGPLEKLIGSIATSRTLDAGKTERVDFVISWHFNHPLQKLNRLKEVTSGEGYYFGVQHKNAAEVGAYVAGKFQTLHAQTLLWHQTYYDSTLPHWLLERTFLNIGTLATANTYRFANGRFWAWEGVNACEGTCTHVWQYAQAMGRIFPSLERDARQRTDLGIAMKEDGGIIFRAEYESRPAIDGQAGTILRIYREHQMSPDNRFLNDNWGQIKKATRFMLAQDKNGDGMTDTPMENTLDAVWEGEIAWIVGLCIAAAKAAALMAAEMNDPAFAAVCNAYVQKGCRNMEEHLFNGEYFIHRPDPVQGRKKLGSYNTCHIDQVYGQSWAHQVGIGRLWNREKTRSALRALWKYNFAPDVGPYIQTHTGGRPYALPGEGGMVMNTNPRNEEKPYGNNVTWQLGYFHECMSGFEHQVASHMMAEGMTDEALVLTRAIHDRYHAAKRNPFNEIECSDHYARAMASYGTFIAACGFEYHGPGGYIRFAPKWGEAHFKAPFTAAEGWGTYEQQTKNGKQTCAIRVKYGRLRLRALSFVNRKAQTIVVLSDGKKIPATFRRKEADIIIELEKAAILSAGQSLIIHIS
ncbi:GH116 family glycosyl hydrolase [Niabella aurantiaca]|uniref:GH116 family glycosyl hydrolase n=1 Tax=Niabella aurantiaca TaxID=379900 RepID=UPI000369809E|nr:GH116 family glycosyl hydrolase [Niabella aurantiaca]